MNRAVGLVLFALISAVTALTSARIAKMRMIEVRQRHLVPSSQQQLRLSGPLPSIEMKGHREEIGRENLQNSIQVHVICKLFASKISHKQILANNHLVKFANIWSTGIFYKSMLAAALVCFCSGSAAV